MKKPNIIGISISRPIGTVGYLGLVMLCVIFFIIGWFSHKSQESLPFNVRDDSPQYFYTNPLLFTQNTDVEFPGLNPLKNLLEKEISSSVANGDVRRASVYFREIDSGRWTGVDPDDLYAPGSLLKVATMIAYLNLGEKDPNVLRDTMYYTYEDNPGQFYKPKNLAPGNYSALGLVQQMIIESDNTAMTLLDSKHVMNILSIYKELRMPDVLDGPDNFLSPRLYSRLFRILYNATYLSRSYSENALKLLTLVKFRDGLVAGVPKDIVVAHKFGEHRFVENNIEKYKQLHDCGIVYYPKNPYFICVMTEGDNFEKLKNTIVKISKITYNYFNSLDK